MTPCRAQRGLCVDNYGVTDRQSSVCNGCCVKCHAAALTFRHWILLAGATLGLQLVSAKTGFFEHSRSSCWSDLCKFILNTGRSLLVSCFVSLQPRLYRVFPFLFVYLLSRKFTWMVFPLLLLPFSIIKPSLDDISSRRRDNTLERTGPVYVHHVHRTEQEQGSSPFVILSRLISSLCRKYAFGARLRSDRDCATL